MLRKVTHVYMYVLSLCIVRLGTEPLFVQLTVVVFTLPVLVSHCLAATWHSLQPSTSIVGAAPRAQPAQGRQRQWRTWERPWACMSLSSTALRAWTTSPWGGCSVAWHRCVRSFVPSLLPHTIPVHFSVVFVLQASILAVRYPWLLLQQDTV